MYNQFLSNSTKPKITSKIGTLMKIWHLQPQDFFETLLDCLCQNVFVLSVDDRTKVLISVTAATKQAPLIMCVL